MPILLSLLISTLLGLGAASPDALYLVRGKTYLAYPPSPAMGTEQPLERETFDLLPGALIRVHAWDSLENAWDLRDSTRSDSLGNFQFWLPKGDYCMEMAEPLSEMEKLLGMNRDAPGPEQKCKFHVQVPGSVPAQIAMYFLQPRVSNALFDLCPDPH